MRHLIIAVIAVLSCASPGFAQFKMPANVYRMTEFEKAQAEAKQKRRPVTIIFTQEQSTCPLCIGASLQIAKALKDQSVMVYNSVSIKEQEQLPPVVRFALADPAAGKYIPKTVIVDSSMTRVLAIIPYVPGKEKLGKQLTKANKLIAQKTSPLKVDENRPVRTWESREGKKVEASLVQEIGDISIVLKKQDGTKVKASRDVLSAADLDYIDELKFGPPADLGELMKAHMRHTKDDAQDKPDRRTIDNEKAIKAARPSSK